MEKKKTLFLCLFLLAPASCCDEPKGVRSIRGALAGAGNPVVFSPSGEKLYSCWENGAVRIYESASGKLLRETSVPLVGTQATDWIGVSKDEARIFVGAFGQDVVVLDSKELKPVEAWKGRIQGACAFAISPDQVTVFWGDNNRTIHLSDLKTGKKTKSAKSLRSAHTLFFDPLCSIDFSKDSKVVLVTNLERGAFLWDIDGWRLERYFRGTTNDNTKVSSAVFNHDGKKVIIVDWDGNIRVFDRKSGEELVVYRARTKRNSALASHPKEDKILSGGADGKVIYWDVGKQKEIPSWTFQRMITCLAISHDAKYACCTTKHAIHIWNMP